MPAALPIREDLSAGELRLLARRENKGRVAARMFAIAHALDGVSRAEAARLAGMDRIGKVFGWVKTVAGHRKSRFRGTARVGWAFTFATAAYNLIRLPKLLTVTP